MSESAIRTGSAQPVELVQAMVRFEERYGGLTYRLLGGNAMEYGLDGDALTGRGTAWILDGDWTWPLDVLPDGRTTMQPGSWPCRVIDRSVDQRIERHALAAEVRTWFHRTFECHPPTGVLPIADESALPPPVPEASGPAEQWWYDDDLAVQATLAGWPPGRDRWTLRCFTRTPFGAGAANPAIFTAVVHETAPVAYCVLCSQAVAPGTTCLL